MSSFNRSRSSLAALVVVLSPLLLPGCGYPPQEATAYEKKAVEYAAGVLSAVRTSIVAVEAFADGKGSWPYTDSVIEEAEDDAGTEVGIFSGIQPPDASSVDLRSELIQILDDATQALEDLRIAFQSHSLDELSSPLEALEDAAGPLETFIEDRR